MNRNQIMDALLKLVAASAQYNTVSRKFRHWSDVQPQEQPAVFLTKFNETYDRLGRGVPQRVTFPVSLFIYARSDVQGSDILPAVAMDDLLDALDAALAAPPGPLGRQTLGGLVYDCRIEGAVLMDPGDLDGQGVAQIPILILVP